MEKIYEENGFEPKQKKISFTTVLSFAVALFAIVSLIAVGFNQISYAEPSTDGAFTLKYGKYDGLPAAVNAFVGGSERLHVQLMFSDSDNAATATKPVFCVQQGVDPSTNYNTLGQIGETGTYYTNYGLITIMNRSGVLGGAGIVPKTLKYPTSTYSPELAGQTLSELDWKAVETYATQTAIWLYLHETTSASDDLHGHLDSIPGGVDVIKGAVELRSTRLSAADMPVVLYQGNIYQTYIKDLVEEAKTATSYKTVRAVLASKSISLVGDNDVYQTDKLTVVANPSSDLIDYSVDLSGLDGAYVVDKDGNKKTGLDSFAPTDFFYVRVPVNKVSEQNSKLNVTISGNFRSAANGEYFLASDGAGQTLIAITSENFRTTNTSEINFMTSEDTGMTTAQTIYFIGLIVLLCGVGIIYANAKPVEEK